MDKRTEKIKEKLKRKLKETELVPVNEKLFLELIKISKKDLSNEELTEICEEVSKNLYRIFYGNGVDDAYMGDGKYIKPDGTIYSKDPKDSKIINKYKNSA